MLSRSRATTATTVLSAAPLPPDGEQRGHARDHEEGRGQEVAARERLAQRGSRRGGARRPGGSRGGRRWRGTAALAARRYGYASGCDRRGPRPRALADPERRQPAQARRPGPGPQSARDLREGARRGRGRRALGRRAARAAGEAARGRARPRAAPSRRGSGLTG